MNETLNEISEWLQKGRAPKVKAAVTKALEEGIPASEILEDGLLAGMDIIGQKFKNNEVFVPEVLVAARAMNRGVEILRPYLVEDGVETKGTVILGTEVLQGNGINSAKTKIEIIAKTAGAILPFFCAFR